MKWYELDFSDKRNRLKLFRSVYNRLKKNKEITKFTLVKSFIIGEREPIEFEEEFEKFISDSEERYDEEGRLVGYKKCYVPVDDNDLPLRRLGVEICAYTDISTYKPRNYVIIKRGDKGSMIQCIHPVLTTMKYDPETDTFYEVEVSEEGIREVELRPEDYYYVIRSFVEFLIENGVLDTLKNSYVSPNSIPMDISIRHQLTMALIDIAPEATFELLIEVIKLFAVNYHIKEYRDRLNMLLKEHIDYFRPEDIERLNEIIYINKLNPEIIVKLLSRNVIRSKEILYNILLDQYYRKYEEYFLYSIEKILKYLHVDLDCDILHKVINKYGEEMIFPLLYSPNKLPNEFISYIFNNYKDVYLSDIVYYCVEMEDWLVDKVYDTIKRYDKDRKYRLLSQIKITDKIFYDIYNNKNVDLLGAIASNRFRLKEEFIIKILEIGIGSDNITLILSILNRSQKLSIPIYKVIYKILEHYNEPNNIKKFEDIINNLITLRGNEIPDFIKEYIIDNTMSSNIIIEMIRNCTLPDALISKIVDKYISGNRVTNMLVIETLIYNKKIPDNVIIRLLNTREIDRGRILYCLVFNYRYKMSDGVIKEVLKYSSDNKMLIGIIHRQYNVEVFTAEYFVNTYPNIAKKLVTSKYEDKIKILRKLVEKWDIYDKRFVAYINIRLPLDILTKLADDPDISIVYILSHRDVEEFPEELVDKIIQRALSEKDYHEELSDEIIKNILVIQKNVSNRYLYYFSNYDLYLESMTNRHFQLPKTIIKKIIDSSLDLVHRVLYNKHQYIPRDLVMYAYRKYRKYIEISVEDINTDLTEDDMLEIALSHNYSTLCGFLRVKFRIPISIMKILLLEGEEYMMLKLIVERNLQLYY